VQVQKTHTEVGARVPLFLTSAQDVVNCQLKSPVTFTLHKKLWYPLNKRLGGCQNQFGFFLVQRNLLPLPKMNKFFS